MFVAIEHVKESGKHFACIIEVGSSPNTYMILYLFMHGMAHERGKADLHAGHTRWKRTAASGHHAELEP